MSAEARNAALALLSRRNHSRYELKRKLRGKGFAGEEIEAALQDLAERGYLDDAKTAAAFVASRARSGKGRGRLAAELAARGVSRADSEAALAGIDPGDEEARLLAALEKRRRTLAAGLTPAARSKKLFDHLVRRGFRPGAVLQALRKKGEPSDDD
jgi:regulatory protein